MIKLVAYPLIVLCISGCNLTPDVASTGLAEPGKSWPQLLPLERLAALENGLGARPGVVKAQTDSLGQKVTALRARAARLNGPVLTDRERQRLAEASASR